jgi:hypothetical protein
VQVVATYRDDQTAASPPLTAVLGELARASSVDVGADPPGELDRTVPGRHRRGGVTREHPALGEVAVRHRQVRGVLADRFRGATSTRPG